MSTPAAFSPDRSGVYRQPSDTNALRERASAEGATWFDVDFRGVHDKASLLDTLACALAFPASFGKNWDALADSLQDLSWHPARAYVLALNAAADLKSDVRQTFLEILRESAIYWKGHGKAFVTFVGAAGDLPEWK